MAWGLRRWGICQFPGSQDQYHRSLDAYYEALPKSRARTDDGEPLEDYASPNWHPGLPSPSPNFLFDSSFQLTHQEASVQRFLELSGDDFKEAG